MRTVTLPSVPIAFRVIGAGPPCVLLHGFGMDSRYWVPFALALRHRFRFILPDLRGFGASHNVAFERECVLSDDADDVNALLVALDLRDVALGGISMGAAAGLRFLEMYGGERVARYLHIDQSPCILNGPDWEHGIFGPAQPSYLDVLHGLLDRARHYGRHTPYVYLPADFRAEVWSAFGAFTSAAMGTPLKQRFARESMGREWIGKRVMPVQSWYVYMDVLAAYLEQNYDLRPVLPGIDVPTTVMIGVHSKMYPPEGQMEVVRRVPGAKAVRFERSGHSLIVDQPARFTRELYTFLQGRAQSQS